MEREKGEGYSANTQRGSEKKAVKRTPLAYGDLFKVESGKRRVRKVLVEGDAGIGKTTLCIAVSEDWANGKLFQQFELVLLLPLRMKAVASAGSLPELLKLLHSDPNDCDSVARYLQRGGGESVLIIADGWDELGESKQQEGSFLYQFLYGHRFCLMSVVVTSRPSASAPLRELPDIDRFVEVRGFSKEHIVEYIQSEFTSDQGKADRLREKLEGNPLVESVCSVPLNCAIVCHLWRTLEEALPTTMTELYTKIILNLVLRNIRKLDTYKSVLKLPKFDSLPADLQQSWWLLCEFAFQALEKDQLVFSQEELEAFFPEGLALDERILCFGLLQSAESVGVGISFHFLHLTFQEYLAALYLTRQPTDKQLENFQTHKSLSPHRFKMVWRFFFGINSSLEFNGDIVSFMHQMLECVAGHQTDHLSVCHCAFEAHNDLVNKVATQYLVTHSNSMVSFGLPHTAHDCSAVLYVIANLQECGYDLDITFCNASENQIKELMDILTSKKGKLQISILNLSDSRLTVSSFQALESAVRGDVLAKLVTLDLEGSLTSDADTNAKWLATLSVHCPNLEYLDLSDNNLGVPGASALAKLHVLDQLYLNETNLGDKGLTIWVKSLKAISRLELADNDIHASGVSCLADAVCSGELKLVSNIIYDCEGVLNLFSNPLGLEGAIAVGRILSSSHCELYNVYLSKCDLTTAGGGLPSADSISCEAVGRQLCQMPQTSTISLLDLDHNSFTGDGIHILAGFIHLCPCLEYLGTCDCDITSDDLIWLLGKLKSSFPDLCSKLEDWNLSDNQIDCRGVSALLNLGLADNDIHASGISCLADAVYSGELLMVLNSLNLGGNPLGLEGTIVVSRMLSSSHCKLHYLSLSRCDLTTAGGSADLKSCEDVGQQLWQMPQTSSRIMLGLDQNSFTGDGIHILAGFMHLCPNLYHLSTCGCGITSDDLIWLLDKLKSSSPGLCSKLKQWILQDNQIDGRGVSALINHLPLLPHLWCGKYNFDIISLYNNPVTHNSEVMENLKEKLKEELTRRRRKRVEELARRHEREKRLEEEVHKEVS